jgi:hypothetical protein
MEHGVGDRGADPDGPELADAAGADGPTFSSKSSTKDTSCKPKKTSPRKCDACTIPEGQE